MVGIALVHPVGQSRVDQWGYVLPAFQHDALYLVGEVPAELNRPFHKARPFSEAAGPVVLVQPLSAPHVPGEISLVDFEHPESCVYVFGGDDVNMTVEEAEALSPEWVVYIPTGEEQLFSATAAAIVLYDRGAKRG